jgi:predicted trehalose synthase
LKKAGYKPKFLAANAPIPEDGLLLTGVFTQKSADGVLHRAAVGQEQPAADVQLYLTTANLLRNVKPLYEPVDKSAADSAGAAIRLNPEVATLKFSLAGNSDTKAVKKLADQIVAELVRVTLQAEAQGLSGSGDPINQYSKP